MRLNLIFFLFEMNVSDIFKNPRYILIILIILIIILLIIILISDIQKESFEGKFTKSFSPVIFRYAKDDSFVLTNSGSLSGNPSDSARRLIWKKPKGVLAPLINNNAKCVVGYDSARGNYEIFKQVGNVKYRWNVYGGCSKGRKKNMQYYKSGNEPAENEQFVFEWVNDDTFTIKTKCGGVVGGSVSASANLYANDVGAIQFKMWDAHSNKYLTKNDFETAPEILKGKGGILGAAKGLMKEATGEGSRFNLRYRACKNGQYVPPPPGVGVSSSDLIKNAEWTNALLDSNLRPSPGERSTASSFIFTYSNGNIVNNSGAVVIPKDKIQSIDFGSGKLVLKQPMYNDDRYCSGCKRKVGISHSGNFSFNVPRSYTCCKQPHNGYTTVREFTIVKV